MTPADFGGVSEAVQHADGVMTPTVFDALLEMCVRFGDAAAALSPEYGRAEYLLNITPMASGARPVLVNALAERARPAAFSRWFAAESVEGKPALLPARWLAHSVGLRHRVVHVFLEPAGRPECLYVQFRSLDKPNAPAAFDVAVGGHAAGAADLDATAAAEIAEELGLDARRDIDGLEAIGAYDYEGRGAGEETVNLEHRSVYRATLPPDRLAQVRFHDGEAAALCLFARHELERLIAERPASCASGLLQSYKLYSGTGVRGA